MVEVRNQARVHLWFESKFGEPYAPLASTAEALDRFVSPLFAVGVRLEPDGGLTVVAPFGLEDLFALRLRPTRRPPPTASHRTRVGSALRPLAGTHRYLGLGDAAMRQWTIDAFASQPFRGNPACVVEPFDAWPDAAWMQALAAENNQAETAFLLSTGRSGPLRPALVHPGAGGAALRPRHPGQRPCAVSRTGRRRRDGPFDTLSGDLRVTRRRRAATRWISRPIGPGAIEAPDGLARALGAEPAEVWAGGYLIVVLENEAAVRALTPDIAALAAFPADRGSRKRRRNREGRPVERRRCGRAGSSRPAPASRKTRRLARSTPASPRCGRTSSEPPWCASIKPILGAAPTWRERSGASASCFAARL